MPIFVGVLVNNTHLCKETKLGLVRFSSNVGHIPKHSDQCSFTRKLGCAFTRITVEVLVCLIYLLGKSIDGIRHVLLNFCRNILLGHDCSRTLKDTPKGFQHFTGRRVSQHRVERGRVQVLACLGEVLQTRYMRIMDVEHVPEHHSHV